MTVTAGNNLTNVIENISIKTTQPLSGSKKITSILMSWKAVLAEFVATLFLVFLGCLACVPIEGLPFHPPLFGPLSFGIAVMFNIQSFGHISGAHMNPAVTLGALLWGKMSIALGIAYIIAQVAGSLAGYGILTAVSPVDLVADAVCTTQPHSQITLVQALFTEIFLTAALNFLNCSFWDPSNEKTMESLSIKFGLTIAGLSITGGHITGASMNPARTFGPALWTGTWNAHWVYWAGPLIGGSFSVLFYKIIWLDTSKK